MRTKKLLILVGFLAGFFLLAAWLYSLRPQSFKPVRLPLHPETSTLVHGSTPDEWLFSNGRYLARFDSKTGEATRLSDTSSLPGISAIVPLEGGKFLAFQSIDEIDSQQFRDLILAQNRQVNQADFGIEGLGADRYKIDVPTWWLLNTATKAISFLSQGSASVEPDGSRVLYAADNNIFSRDLATGEDSLVYSGTVVKDFHKQGSNLEIYTGSQLLSYSLIKNAVEQRTDSGFIVFNHAGNCYLSYESAGSDSQTQPSLTCGPNHSQIREKGQEVHIDFTADGQSLIIANGSHIKVVDTNLKVRQKYELPVSQGFEFVRAYSPSAMLFKKADSYYLSTPQPVGFPIIAENKTLQQKDGLKIVLEKDSQFVVVKGGRDHQDEAVAALKANGYRDSFFTLLFEQ